VPHLLKFPCCQRKLSTTTPSSSSTELPSSNMGAFRVLVLCALLTGAFGDDICPISPAVESVDIGKELISLHSTLLSLRDHLTEQGERIKLLESGFKQTPPASAPAPPPVVEDLHQEIVSSWAEVLDWYLYGSFRFINWVYSEYIAPPFNWFTDTLAPWFGGPWTVYGSTWFGITLFTICQNLSIFLARTLSGLRRYNMVVPVFSFGLWTFLWFLWIQSTRLYSYICGGFLNSRRWGYFDGFGTTVYNNVSNKTEIIAECALAHARYSKCAIDGYGVNHTLVMVKLGPDEKALLWGESSDDLGLCVIVTVRVGARDLMFLVTAGHNMKFGANALMALDNLQAINKVIYRFEDLKGTGKAGITWNYSAEHDVAIAEVTASDLGKLSVNGRNLVPSKLVCDGFDRMENDTEVALLVNRDLNGEPGLWWSNGTVSFGEHDGYDIHTASTIGGHSGAPLFLVSGLSKRPALLEGIHIGGVPSMGVNAYISCVVIEEMIRSNWTSQLYKNPESIYIRTYSDPIEAAQAKTFPPLPEAEGRGVKDSDGSGPNRGSRRLRRHRNNYEEESKQVNQSALPKTKEAATVGKTDPIAPEALPGPMLISDQEKALRESISKDVMLIVSEQLAGFRADLAKSELKPESGSVCSELKDFITTQTSQQKVLLDAINRISKTSPPSGIQTTTGTRQPWGGLYQNIKTMAISGVSRDCVYDSVMKVFNGLSFRTRKAFKPPTREEVESAISEIYPQYN